MRKHSKAKNIALIAIRLVEHRIVDEDLGGNIAWGPTFVVIAVFHLMVGDEGQSEVNQFWFQSLIGQNYVVRLDVPMNNVFAVAFLDCW